MRLKKFELIVGLLVWTLFTIACKKETVIEPIAINPDPVVSTSDRIKDTVLLYAQDAYLWNSQIPSGFNPRTYADPDKIMTAIRAFSQEPGFSNPVDRWSFAIKQSEWDNISAGVSEDF